MQLRVWYIQGQAISTMVILVFIHLMKQDYHDFRWWYACIMISLKRIKLDFGQLNPENLKDIRNKELDLIIECLIAGIDE